MLPGCQRNLSRQGLRILAICYFTTRCRHIHKRCHWNFLSVSLRLFSISFGCVLLSFWYNSLPRLHIFSRIGGWYTGECGCFLSCGVILYLYLCANVVFGPLGPKRSSITAQPALQALTWMLLPHISLISLFTSVSIRVRLLLLPKQPKSCFFSRMFMNDLLWLQVWQPQLWCLATPDVS